jgi:hypothetical protein
MTSRTQSALGTSRRRLAVGLLLLSLAAAAPAWAQTTDSTSKPHLNIQEATRMAVTEGSRLVPARDEKPSAHAKAVTPGAAGGRSKGQRAAWAALGAAGGFFGGLGLGAAIEGDRCNCDDPGLVGALIGAPIGAITGGIVAWKLSGRK